MTGRRTAVPSPRRFASPTVRVAGHHVPTGNLQAGRSGALVVGQPGDDGPIWAAQIGMQELGAGDLVERR